MFNHLSQNKTLMARITAGFFVAILIASNTGTIALAADVDFYAGNDINLYSANAIACSTSSSPNTDPTNVSGADVAEKVFNFITTTSFKGLENKTMNAVQAAGVLGNFQRESGMDPASVQAGGGGRGLAQWDDRAKALYAFADKQGKPWQDLDVQLGYLKLELDGWEGTNLVDHGFMTVSKPEDAALVFEDAFERSGVMALEERKKYAVEYYAKFGGTVTNTKNTNAFVGGCRYTGSGPVGDYMDNNSFISYSQCSTESNGGGVWGTRTNTYGNEMCAAGCGPTSAAMVIRNMTGSNVTPEDMRKFYNDNNLWQTTATYSNQHGSGPDGMRKAADKWGIRHEGFDPRDLDAYKQIFANGGLAIVGGQGAEPFYPGFGHYVVVRGITEDGKFRVSDPGRGLVKDYDINAFMAGASQRVSNATAFYSSGPVLDS